MNRSTARPPAVSSAPKTSSGLRRGLVGLALLIVDAPPPKSSLGKAWRVGGALALIALDLGLLLFVAVIAPHDTPLAVPRLVRGIAIVIFALIIIATIACILRLAVGAPPPHTTAIVACAAALVRLIYPVGYLPLAVLLARPLLLPLLAIHLALGLLLVSHTNVHAIDPVGGPSLARAWSGVPDLIVRGAATVIVATAAISTHSVAISITTALAASVAAASVAYLRPHRIHLINRLRCGSLLALACYATATAALGPSHGLVHLILAILALIAGMALPSHPPLTPLPVLRLEARFRSLLVLDLGPAVVDDLHLETVLTAKLSRARYAVYISLHRRAYDEAAELFNDLATKLTDSQADAALVALEQQRRHRLGTVSLHASLDLQLALGAARNGVPAVITLLTKDKHAPDASAIPRMIYHMRAQLRAEDDVVVASACTAALAASCASSRCTAFPHIIQRLLWSLYGGERAAAYGSHAAGIVSAFHAQAAHLDLSPSTLSVLTDVIRGPTVLSPASSLLAAALTIAPPWKESGGSDDGRVLSRRSSHLSIVNPTGLIEHARQLAHGDDVATLVARALGQWIDANIEQAEHHAHPAVLAGMAHGLPGRGLEPFAGLIAAPRIEKQRRGHQHRNRVILPQAPAG